MASGRNRALVNRVIIPLTPVVVLVVGVLLLQSGPRNPMPFEDPTGRPRSALEAQDFVAVAGTPWAAETMGKVLAEGGNAIDAAIAGLLVLNVTFGDAASFPGIAPLLVWDAKAGKALSYIGVGKAPKRATIEAFASRGHEVVPKYDAIAQLVPASPDVIVELLTALGTRGFAELVTPAIHLAEEGFPIHRTMARNLDLNLLERFGFRFLMPYNAEVYTQGQWWRPIRIGDRFRRPDLAKTLRRLARVEQDCQRDGGGRVECLAAVRDYFYRGPIAEAIVALQESEDGFMDAADLGEYSGRWESPLRGRFRNHEVLTNGTWTQGIVVPMALQILDPLDLARLGHNSAAYVHTVVQALELSMADREAYVGDPDFVDVPTETLLDPSFAASRRRHTTDHAFGALPAPGSVPGRHGTGWRAIPANDAHLASTPSFGRDTSYLAVIDKEGNSVSLTPSDFPQSPMVPGTGLTLGIRMTQFRLDPASPTALAPGKRPRVTPHALMLLRNKRHVMSLGTPGGEMQTQASVQVLLNHLVFDLEIQKAIDAPRFRCLTWPDSFSPHHSEPGVVELEATLYDEIAGDLEDLGYQVRRWPDWDNYFGAVGAVMNASDSLIAGSDPREATTARGR